MSSAVFGRGAGSRLTAALGLGELCLHVLQLKRKFVALFAKLLVLGLQLVNVHASGRSKRHLYEAARGQLQQRERSRLADRGPTRRKR